MKPFRPRRSATVAGLVLLGLLPTQDLAHAAAAEPLLRPTPLVLKDGRIANVSIHVLPFAAGQAELAVEPAEYLTKLTRAVGTDCFLTAQVIGHIASSEIAGDDTMNAHRLARSRADAVQASLIGGGLPAKAIASVWDWQFMVREPRATLWVFELTAGEDCEGRQLQGDLVAEVSPPAEQGDAAPERVTKPAAAPAEPPAAPSPQPSTAAAKPAATAARPAVTARADAAPQVARSSTPPAQPPVVARPAAAPAAAEAPAQPETAPGQAGHAATSLTATAPAAVAQTVARAEPAEPPATAAAQAPAPAQSAGQPATAGAQSVAAAQPAKPAATAEAPAQPAKSARAEPQTAATARPAEQPATAAPQIVARAQPAEQAAAGAAAATPQAAAKPSTDDGKVEHDPAGGLIITFATNSSYFPSGAAARLRDLLAGTNGEKRYQVTLQVAVSGTTQVVGAKSADEAARYNKWLAERRVERVQAWLAKNARPEALSIKPEYVANDDSRRLTVRLAPTG